jgi:hypothetical protein
MSDTIRINPAPALTLWAAVVAERLGIDRDTALTLGQSVAGSSAYAKVREQGPAEGEQLYVGLLDRPVPVVQHRTGCGLL